MSDSLAEKYKAMDAYRLEQDDLPDGAFFQLAEDSHGWTADDWAWFSDEYARRELRAESEAEDRELIDRQFGGSSKP